MEMHSFSEHVCTAIDTKPHRSDNVRLQRASVGCKSEHVMHLHKVDDGPDKDDVRVSTPLELERTAAAGTDYVQVLLRPLLLIAITAFAHLMLPMAAVDVTWAWAIAIRVPDFLDSARPVHLSRSQLSAVQRTACACRVSAARSAAWSSSGSMNASVAWTSQLC